MRIGIDALSIGAHKTGLETYIYNLVKQLSLLEPDGDEYIVYLRATDGVVALDSNPQFQRRRIWACTPYITIPVAFPLESRLRRWDVFHAQFILPLHLRSGTVLTVYDLSYERFPQFFTYLVRLRKKLGVPWSCQRADRIITISEFSKRELVEIYRLDPRRITVTYPGPPEDCKPMDAEQTGSRLRGSYNVTTPFILYVGNLEPRKNVSRLLQAFAQLKQEERIAHKLVIVGQKAWLYKEIFETIRSHSLEGEIVLTGYVPADDLPVFYNGASLLVYPSLYEGFGLPVIEAMACGTPVITSFGSSLEEIAKEAAILVDPYSVSSIAKAIEKVANDLDLQRDLRNRGLARAAQFSFRKMAEQTRSVYHQL